MIRIVEIATGHAGEREAYRVVLNVAVNHFSNAISMSDTAQKPVRPAQDVVTLARLI